MCIRDSINTVEVHYTNFYNYRRTPIIWSRRNYIQEEDLKWTRDKKEVLTCTWVLSSTRKTERRGFGDLTFHYIVFAYTLLSTRILSNNQFNYRHHIAQTLKNNH